MLDMEDKLERTTEFIAAGGASKAKIAKVDLIEVFSGFKKFCKFEDIQVIVPNPDTIPYVVLGRDSIFMEYDIEYREHKEHILFKKPKRDSRVRPKG